MSVPTPEPVEVRHKKGARRLIVTWHDGHVSTYPLDYLRSWCPCASCQGHHPSQSLNLTAEQFSDIRINDLATVGRYAYSISWSDGHNTGLYTLNMLSELENSA